MEKELTAQAYSLAAPHRQKLRLLVFGGILLILMYNWLSNTLVHQLKAPQLHYPYVDITYWLFLLTGLPDFLVQNFVAAYAFDILLIGSAALSLVFTTQRYSTAAFFLLAACYFLVYNSFGMAHIHSKIALLLLPVPFLARSGKAFAFLWAGLRYYTLFIFTAAFAWKLVRGTMFHPDQAVFILQKNLAAYLYFNPDTTLALLYRWCLAHPSAINACFILGCFCEGVFIIGFFTRRFDRWLALLVLLIPAGFLFIADAFFFEMSLLALAFLPFSKSSGRHVQAINA